MKIKCGRKQAVVEQRIALLTLEANPANRRDKRQQIFIFEN